MAHLSDTHLGYAEYEARDPGTGLNARELDVYRSFERACREIAGLKPDLLLHSGDLFDHPRPPNHAIVLALRQFAALGRSGIPVVLAAGNHSLPADRGAACIVDALGALDGVHVAVDRPRSFRVGAACVAAIPHLRREADLVRAVEEARPDPAARYNILLVHAGLCGGPPREWTEARVPRGLIREKAGLFDYVALGHYHRPMKAAPMAWYAGAIERFQEDRSRGEKGFLVADLDRRAVRRHVLPTRPAVELGPFDCTGLPPPEIMNLVREASAAVAPGSIVRLTLAGLAKEACEALDMEEVRRRLGRALWVDVRLRRKRTRQAKGMEWSLAPLREQFEEFVSDRVGDADLRRDVLRLARSYFDRARREEDG